MIYLFLFLGTATSAESGSISSQATPTSSVARHDGSGSTGSRLPRASAWLVGRWSGGSRDVKRPPVDSVAAGLPLPIGQRGACSTVGWLQPMVVSMATGARKPASSAATLRLCGGEHRHRGERGTCPAPQGSRATRLRWLFARWTSHRTQHLSHPAGSAQPPASPPRWAATPIGCER